MAAEIDLQSRFLGCLLGLALGDALGAPFEGIDALSLYQQFGPARKIVDDPPVEELIYTDDTEMTIGVMECLLDEGRIDPNALARIFAANYSPSRGYGPGTRKILDTMVAGGNWRPLRTAEYPEGSLGNGAAMRVAPVGLFFCNDLDRVRSEAALSAEPTHLHPIGIDGAVILATAVALLALQESFSPGPFYAQLQSIASTEEFRWQLRTASRLSPGDPISFGSSLEAHRSVVTAITCFSFSPESYQETIARAISFGDDTDTVAAMAGALSGAYLGLQGLPARQLSRLEDGRRGRGYIQRRADELCRKLLA